jgi:class 3 adenylate cyclase/tetratricopeptide (TPR) repeat protein
VRSYTCPMPTVAVGEARKIVTILFADIVASTELGDRLDPEALRHVVSRFFAEMATVLEAHGGTVEKFIGDEVMAVFGVPAAHEDDALRAVRAAIAMQAALAPLNEELDTTWGARLESRIAINTGEVVAGDASTGHGFVTGDAVNLAKRLQTAARPGQILIGDATHALVRHAVHTSPVGPLALKGKDDPVGARLLDDVDAAPEAFARRLDTPLVGRTTELGRLLAVLERAVKTRRPQLVTILGPAGIGKSRLVRELLEQVTGRADTLVGRCLPYGEGITFWPIREMLPGERLDGTAEEIFRQIRSALEQRARARPLVVCFEDVHWGEPTFLDLVEYLAGWVRDSPVFLVCNARPELLERRPDWPTSSPDAWVLHLGGLNDEEIRELLDALAAPETALDRIAGAAEGNPLFVEQIVAMAVDEGAEVAIPPSIRALLAARLDRLQPDELTVVERAAVVGRDFPLSAVLELVPDELRERSQAILLGLVRKELIRPHTDRDADGFRFRHVLIRDAAYEAVPKQLRAELHERHAAWLEASEHPAILVGYHLEQAVSLIEDLGRRDTRSDDLARRAGALLGAAGQRAFARGDLPAATGLLTRATALLASNDSMRLEFASELAAAYRDLGETAKADELLEGTIAEATALGDERLESRARIVRSSIRSQLSPGGAAEDVAHVAETAIEVFTAAGDEVGLAQAWSHLSRFHLISSRWGAASDALEQALVHARRAGHRREEAVILGQLALSLYWGPAPVEEAIARCKQMLAETGHDPAVTARVTVSIAGLEAMRGRFERARELYWQSKEALADLGLKPWLAAHTLAISSIETLAGDPGAAEDELRFGVETLDELGMRSSFSTLASALARTSFEQGRWEEAEQLVERARDAAASDDIASEVLWRTTSARILTARGELDRADGMAREAVRLAEGTDALNLHADSLVDLARVAAARGDRAGAGTALEEAVRLYRRKGNDVAAHRAYLFRVSPLDTSGTKA